MVRIEIPRGVGAAVFEYFVQAFLDCEEFVDLHIISDARQNSRKVVR